VTWRRYGSTAWLQPDDRIAGFGQRRGWGFASGDGICPGDGRMHRGRIGVRRDGNGDRFAVCDVERAQESDFWFGRGWRSFLVSRRRLASSQMNALLELERSHSPSPSASRGASSRSRRAVTASSAATRVRKHNTRKPSGRSVQSAASYAQGSPLTHWRPNPATSRTLSEILPSRSCGLRLKRREELPRSTRVQPPERPSHPRLR
jgi:hypothetical protein